MPSDFAGGIGCVHIHRSRSSISLAQNPTSCSAVRSDANSSVSSSVWRAAVAHDILILEACARNIPAIAIQIAEPEVTQRERIVQIERAAQRLQRFFWRAASSGNHPAATDARVARDR